MRSCIMEDAGLEKHFSLIGALKCDVFMKFSKYWDYNRISRDHVGQV